MSIRPDYLVFGRPSFSDEEVAAVTRVLRSGWVGMGAEVQAFESELGQALGAPHVVTVNSATSALFLSLLVHGVGKGDHVVVPSLTWCSTANAAMHLGAKPVFCDVDPSTLCVTPETVARRITSKTKAVVAVHYGGRAIEIDRLRAALPKRVALIEDAAHAFGARFENGDPVGSSGNPTCLSFYANKNLSTAEGGAVALKDRALAEKIRSLRQHGLANDAWKRFTEPRMTFLNSRIEILGYKMNYTDLQAAIGRVQLRRQPELDEVRLKIAKRYEKGLAGLPGLACIAGQTGPGHARHLFVIRVGKAKLSRDELFLALRKRNVGVGLHYDPLHLMPLYRAGKTRLPHTEAAGRSIMTLPISASMSVSDADYVTAQVRDLAG